MNDVIQTLYIKRFNVLNNKVHCCNTGPFHHISCIFDKNLNNILCYGINHYKSNNTKSIHAEHHAILKLPIIKHKKIKINIFVIRFTKLKKICSSKPCNSCIKYMKELAPKKGYAISNVYYTDGDGTINKIKLSKIFNERNK